MIKNLTAHGNSAALIIDKAVLQLLKIDFDTPLEITTDGKCLVITPIKDTVKRKRLRASMKRVNKKHGKTLRKLAK